MGCEGRRQVLQRSWSFQYRRARQREPVDSASCHTLSDGPGSAVAEREYSNDQRSARTKRHRKDARGLDEVQAGPPRKRGARRTERLRRNAMQGQTGLHRLLIECLQQSVDGLGGLPRLPPGALWNRTDRRPPRLDSVASLRFALCWTWQYESGISRAPPVQGSLVTRSTCPARPSAIDTSRFRDSPLAANVCAARLEAMGDTRCDFAAVEPGCRNESRLGRPDRGIRTGRGLRSQILRICALGRIGRSEEGGIWLVTVYVIVAVDNGHGPRRGGAGNRESRARRAKGAQSLSLGVVGWR